MGGVTNHRHSYLQRATLLLLLIAAMFVPQMLLAQTATQPTNGDGSADNPYQITTAEELAWFRDKVNSTNGDNSPKLCAKLMNDISLSSVCHAASNDKEELSWTPISTAASYYQNWGGTFDGNGKAISDLYINAKQEKVGLFGTIYGGCVKNLTIKNANVTNTGNQYTGILVGYADKATIQNIVVDALSSVSFLVERAVATVGGIAGALGGDIQNCENHAKVKSDAANTGGICGQLGTAYNQGTIKGCYNDGVVTGTEGVAGIVGYVVKGNIEDCANYAKITGNMTTAGIAGHFASGELKNVFSNGNVESKFGMSSGMLVAVGSFYVDGLIAYDSDATLIYDGNKKETQPFGKDDIPSTKATGFSKDILATGSITYLLQQFAGEGIIWGQNLYNTQKAYPILGSTSKVYASGNVTYKCSGTLGIGDVYTIFTNTQPTTKGTFKITHGNMTHHPAVAVQCLTDGQKEYYECEDCHKYYSDAECTTELKDVVITALGHDYYGEKDVCSRCRTKIPLAKLGNNIIKIDRTPGNYAKIIGFNLWKYVVPASGTLEVTAIGSNSVTGILCNSSKDKELRRDYDSGEGNNFKFYYDVKKGETYYIGARQYSGIAIDGDYTLSIKLNGTDCVMPEGLTGSGTAEAPYELKTAEHLKWFADYVNGLHNVDIHPEACAKLADNINLSSECHPASDGQEELSWNPISSSSSVYWKGTFDGNGKTLSNLYIKTSQTHAGLFGSISSGTIKDLTIENAQVNNIDSYNYCSGIVVGYANGATIQNVKTDEQSSITAKENTGGIAGRFTGSLLNCENHAVVNLTSSSGGGICGKLDNSTSQMKGCTNWGEIQGGEKGKQIGGLVGTLTSGTIELCANYATISGASQIGGIVGYAAQGTIKNVFTYGDVIAFGFSENISAGFVVGFCQAPNDVTAASPVFYNREATFTINKEAKDNTVGGVNKLATGHDVMEGFTKAEFLSGKVAYKLNNGVTDGTQAWYQKLNRGGEAYPTPIKAEGKTVYEATGTECDGTAVVGEFYANTLVYNEPHDYQETQLSSGVYAFICTDCKSYQSDKRFIKNFSGEGKDLEVTEVSDGVYKKEELTLNDGETYYSPTKFTVENLTYNRNFSGTEGKWQALYVPFAFDCADLNDSYEVANIDNFHEYEQKDGSTKVVLEVKKLTAGTLKPLRPYVIRLKEGGDATQTIFNGNKTIELVPSASKYIDCSSTARYYKFTGILEAKQGFTVNQDYALQNGKLILASANAKVKAQRWYLTATDREGNTDQQMAKLQSIDIQVIDEGEATGIKDIYVTTETEARQSSRHGIYDLQGRKLDKEPTSGIYIKDGKKWVK